MIVTPVTLTFSNPKTLRSLQRPSTRVAGQPKDQQGGNNFFFQHNNSSVSFYNKVSSPSSS